jgi:UDP-glucose 4-epimerase
MTTSKQKIVVTGGSGFIGAYFCRLLKERGDDVVILDLVKPTELSPHDQYVYGDIRDEVAVREAFADCDNVIHLAAAESELASKTDRHDLLARKLTPILRLLSRKRRALEKLRYFRSTNSTLRQTC